MIPTLMKRMFARPRTVVLLTVALVTAGCGAGHDQTSSKDTGKIRADSANGNVSGVAAAVPAAASHKKQFAEAPRHAAAARPDTGTAAKDSTTPRRMPLDSSIKLDLLKERTRKDNFSLLAAVKSGLRMMDKWPSHDALAGSILPTKRIVAFYGNPLSKKMGVLGEYPVDTMLAKFDKVIADWKAVDPETPVQPALHLIAVVAQGSPGRDGKYRLRMTDSLIEKVYGWAKSRNAILFLDVQVAGSTLQEELPRLIPFLSRPDVHLGIDPEFSMHYTREGLPPGNKIGTMDAADINYAADLLSKLVTEKKLPPKVLIVHRFTRPMVRNASAIKVLPNVQIVMNMDGWGAPWLKFDSYEAYIVREPVQFTGFKLFFHNDTKAGEPLLTPREVLLLLPRPMYIQYQ
jgi:hypothetical protein